MITLKIMKMNKCLLPFVNNFPIVTFKPLKIKGESYNEEVSGSRQYAEVKDGSITAGLELTSERVVFAPPIIKPLNIDGVSKVGMYIKPSLDIPIVGGIETKRVFETGKYLINKPFYVSVSAKGCLEAGLVAELIAAKALVDFEVRGYGKGCLGGGWKFQNNNTKEPIFKIELDPVVVGISAKISSKGYITFTLVDTSYEYALTKPYQIYPRD